MKIFVGFRFKPENGWIPDMIFPIIQAFGSQVVTGQNLQGQDIGQGSIARVEESDAMVALFTRHTKLNDRGEPEDEPHSWLLQEAGAALAKKLRVLPVVQVGAPLALGALQNLQRLNYDPAKRDVLMVDFVKAMAEWHKDQRIRHWLIPAEAVGLIRRSRSGPGFRCTYAILRDGHKMPAEDAEIIPQFGGVFAVMRNVRRGDLVQVRVEGGGEVWESELQSVDEPRIQLEKMQ